MKSRRLMVLGLMAIALLGFNSSALADGYAGLLAGPSFVNDGVGVQAVYGGHIGVKLSPVVDFGFYGTHETLGSASGPGISESVGETVLALETNLYILSNFPLYIGIKAGVGITSGSINTVGSGNDVTVGATYTDFAAGPSVGVQFPIAPNVTLGGEANAIFVTTSGDALALVNLLGVINYHF